MPMPSDAPIDLPDGVEPLGVDGVVRALQSMQLKVGLDQCCGMMRKWAAEGRITPQKKIIIGHDVEAAIRMLTCNGNVDAISERKRVDPPSRGDVAEPAPKQPRIEAAAKAAAPPPAVKAAAPPALAPAAPADGVGRAAAVAKDAAGGAVAAAAEEAEGKAEKAPSAADAEAAKSVAEGTAAAADATDGGDSKLARANSTNSISSITSAEDKAAANKKRKQELQQKAKDEKEKARQGRQPQAKDEKEKLRKEFEDKEKARQERLQKTRDERGRAREMARREQEEKLAEEERLRKERAQPFEGLSIEEMREKRLTEVLEEMSGRMRDIVRRTATALGAEAPDEAELAKVCGSAMDADRREAYLRLIHTVVPTVAIPEGLEAELMPYQVDGLEWLVSIYANNLHGILADEMGLGKTLQTIAWLQYLKEFKEDKGPHLIVAPKSTLTNWESEFKKFAPTYKVWLLVGVQEEREQLAHKLKKRSKHNQTTVFVTNYEQIHRNEWLQDFDWQCIVIDEGHRMKNQKSVLHETMTKMRCRTRMLLTGTPLQNNMNELWALLHYLLPELFASTLNFQQWFLEPLRGVSGLNEYEVQLSAKDEAMIISRLHTMLSPFLLQRTKAQVMEDKLPPKVEATVRVQLSAWQRSAYSDLEKRTIRLLSSTEDKVETRRVNNALMQLRKLVLHPFLFMSDYKVGPDLFRTSGKVEVLDRMLARLLPCGHKTLIFSQFTSVLDILAAFLDWRGHSFVRLDGRTPHEERRARIETFNSKVGGPMVFLLSSRAGGLGLNLQTADTVILFDLDWNPQNDKQAVARAHRIGQQREVRVFRLITESGVERHMERRCREKLDLEKKIMGAGMFTKGSSQEQRADMLRSILGLASGGAEDAEKAEQPVTSVEELSALLARGPEEPAAFGRLDAELLAERGGAADGEALPPLVRCGRLMREDEVPDGFRLNEDGDSGNEEGW